MTDRELLEDAARAAGIGWDRDSEVWFGEPFVRCDWNPLTDDGDALRLRNRLGLNLFTGRVPGGGSMLICACSPVSADHSSEKIDAHTDEHAATRRAIVRAAAALANSMTPNV